MIKVEFYGKSWVDRIEFLDRLDADEFEFVNICDCFIWRPLKDSYVDI